MYIVDSDIIQLVGVRLHLVAQLYLESSKTAFLAPTSNPFREGCVLDTAEVIQEVFKQPPSYAGDETYEHWYEQFTDAYRGDNTTKFLTKLRETTRQINGKPVREVLVAATREIFRKKGFNIMDDSYQFLQTLLPKHIPFSTLENIVILEPNREKLKINFVQAHSSKPGIHDRPLNSSFVEGVVGSVMYGLICDSFERALASHFREQFYNHK